MMIVAVGLRWFERVSSIGVQLVMRQHVLLAMEAVHELRPNVASHDTIAIPRLVSAMLLQSRPHSCPVSSPLSSTVTVLVTAQSLLPSRATTARTRILEFMRRHYVITHELRMACRHTRRLVRHAANPRSDTDYLSIASDRLDISVISAAPAIWCSAIPHPHSHSHSHTHLY